MPFQVPSMIVVKTCCSINVCYIQLSLGGSPFTTNVPQSKVITWFSNLPTSWLWRPFIYKIFTFLIHLLQILLWRRLWSSSSTLIDFLTWEITNNESSRTITLDTLRDKTHYNHANKSYHSTWLLVTKSIPIHMGALLIPLGSINAMIRLTQ